MARRSAAVGSLPVRRMHTPRRSVPAPTTSTDSAPTRSSPVRVRNPHGTSPAE
jgi:hypothetical protein